MSSISNKDAKPTATDRAIWEFLSKGGMVNNRIAYQHFGTARLSDNIYRLRNNGFFIPDGIPVYYKKNGVTKHYFNFQLKQKIIKAGAKVEK